MPAKSKITVTHPLTGTKRQFDAAVYEPVKAAILESLKGSKGKTWTQLSEDVVKIMKKKAPGFKGSVPWYTISVRLDLESRGVVETFIEKGTKMNRLL